MAAFAGTESGCFGFQGRSKKGDVMALGSATGAGGATVDVSGMNAVKDFAIKAIVSVKNGLPEVLFRCL
jgi:hypothetical protein